VVSLEELHTEKWLSLRRITYTDPLGKPRQWESVHRTTKTGPIDAVDIIALVTKSGEPTQILLVKQFRAPVGKLCIEFPSGLVDAGETPEEAALRELREETGFTAKISSVSPETSYEPGLTDSTCAVVHAQIDGDAECNLNPQQDLQEDEFIERLLVPVGKLLEALKSAARENLAVDAKLWTFAMGLSLASLVGRQGE